MRDLKRQSNVSGITKNWVVATFINYEKENVDIEFDTELKILFGQIHFDFKHRFSRGKWFRSSLIKTADLDSGMVTTLNSIYQLNGDGYEMIVEPEFYALFECYFISPLQIAEKHPAYIHSKRAVSGDVFKTCSIDSSL